MARFGRKKKKNSPSPEMDDDFGILNDIDDEEDYTTSSYAMGSYEDFEGQEIPEDILGIDDDAPVKKEKKKSKAPIVLGVIIFLFGGGLLISQFVDTAPPQEPDTETIDTRVEGETEGLVVDEQLGVTYEGSANGSPVNGTGAILALDHAYYVDRDAAAVMEHFDPSLEGFDRSYVQSKVQAYIDKVPGGTTHSLSISPRQIGVSYDVVLTLNIPGEDPATYDQNFEVVHVDGKYYVKNFTSTGFDQMR